MSLKIRSNEFAEFGKLVWVPDAIHGYRMARLVDIGSEQLTVKLVDNLSANSLKFAYNDVLAAHDDDASKSVDDSCALMYLNEATLLHNCKLRYAQKQIYTYVAHVLISLNPYETLPGLYSDATIQRYSGVSLGVLPPHIFALADKAYREMRIYKKDMAIVVSGESGAGKTESQKAILRYLCHHGNTTRTTATTRSHAGAVEQRIIDTNPILEAFGNAKTSRNNNSSRFGKFVEIHFDSKYQVASGNVSHYLLEKTRVCRQQPGERNFHVFFQLFANEAIAQKLCLTQSPDRFQYLRHGCTQFFTNSPQQIPAGQKTDCLQDSIVDDLANFSRLCDALLEIRMSVEEREALFQTLGGILHLGNVEFDDRDDSRGGSIIKKCSTDSLKIAARLLGVEAQQLQLGLTSRMMQATKGGVKGTLIMVPLKAHEAAAARDALAKAIYNRLFDQVVSAINQCFRLNEIEYANRQHFIGVLDIAGFEFFENNSFEQFCINYCNEKLQHFFNDRILRHEQDLYAAEGLNVPRIDYSDNQDCIELFETKIHGLFDCLDQEARLPKSSAQHFTLEVQRANRTHSKITSARKSNIRAYREMRDEDGFTVRHYATQVVYDTTQFLEKNNDALHVSLEMLLSESRNSFIVKAFDDKANITVSGKSKSGKLIPVSVGSKFRTQLALLIEKLANTGTHFMRCIKPNTEMKPGVFIGSEILAQLKCAGMGSVLRLMQRGYPSRTSFASLYTSYENSLPPELRRLDSRLFCKCLFHALGLNDTDFKFGLTKVFFRPGKFAEFDRLLGQDPECMKMLIDRVRCWIHHVRWRKAQFGVWSCIKWRHCKNEFTSLLLKKETNLVKNKIVYRAANLIKIQSGFRALHARRIHRPTLVAFSKANALERDAQKLLEMPLSIKNWPEKVEDFLKNAQKLRLQIKTRQIDAKTGLLECERLRALLDEYMQAIKMESKKKEEELRIQQLQDKRTNAQRAEEEEFQKLKEQQQIQETRKKLEMQRKHVLDSSIVQKGIPQTTFSESGTQTDLNPEKPVPVTTSSYAQDLLNWTYAKLRDSINTSTNIDFLQACRDEFHRRLRMWHDWTTSNPSTDVLADVEVNHILPTSVPETWTFLQYASEGRLADATVFSEGNALCISRFFRVPLERPMSGSSQDYVTLPRAKAGYWYAHFEGRHIVRQVELRDGKLPLLLKSGVDDDRMCRLTLDETRLPHRKGAEILASDFDTIWRKHGGAEYVYRIV